MKKKQESIIPEGLGDKVVSSFLDIERRFYDALSDFLKEAPELKEALEDPETKGIMELLIFTPTPLPALLIAVGFTLGQKFDLVDEEALEAMDFIWRWMKEKEWFFLFPAEKRIKPVMKKGGCDPGLIELS